MLQLLFFIIACISIAFLMYIKVNILLAFLITFVLLLVCNLMIGFIMLTNQRRILDWECDPEKYLKLLDKQEKRLRKNKRALKLLTINRAVGHMLLGDYEAAKDYLLGIDTSYLSEKNESYLVYAIDLILCYYELGEIEKAEELYETKLIQLSPLGKRIRKSVDILIGERYYFLQKYDVSYEHLQKLLNADLSKRQYLGVLFRLAQMDVIKGESEQAIKKFNKIIKLGNKLGIVEASKEMLSQIEKSEVMNAREKIQK